MKSKKAKPETDHTRLVGYARVSTDEQSVTMQVEKLQAAGIPDERIYRESASGSRKDRPQLKLALQELREGDTLVVWKLDRIARSMTHLLELLKGLDEEGVKFRSLTEGVETQTPAGKLITHVLAALSEFERDLIRERTRAGVAAARERGVKFGADPKIKDEDMPVIWRKIHEEGVMQIDVAKEYGVVPLTIARRLQRYENERVKVTKKLASRRKKQPNK